MNYLGKYLKKKVKELKVSEREISSKCGISHSYLNQLIKGVNPSTKKNISPTLLTFEKLSRGFDVPIELLQKVARGIAEEKELNARKDNISFIAENQNVSPELLKQINEFQDFISLVGLDNKIRSEKEWTELIYDLKHIIKEHFEEIEKPVLK